jgi:hypothetical protein
VLLATIALTALVTTNAPARDEPARPCADPSLLCRISPYFCPGTYPAGLDPCWPEARPTRNLPNRPAPGPERGTSTAAPERDVRDAAPANGRAARNPSR